LIIRTILSNSALVCTVNEQKEQLYNAEYDRYSTNGGTVGRTIWKLFSYSHQYSNYTARWRLSTTSLTSKKLST